MERPRRQPVDLCHADISTAVAMLLQRRDVFQSCASASSGGRETTTRRSAGLSSFPFLFAESVLRLFFALLHSAFFEQTFGSEELWPPNVSATCRGAKNEPVLSVAFAESRDLCPLHFSTPCFGVVRTASSWRLQPRCRRFLAIFTFCEQTHAALLMVQEPLSPS